MAIELRTWQTSEGIDIPYYKLPWTLATLNANVDPSFGAIRNQLYQYPNFNSGDLLASPYVEGMRWIARKVFQGWNPRNATAFAPAGSFLWLTTSGPSGPAQSHSPGAATWVDGVTYEYLESPGASVPGWVGSSRAQFRPFPGELFGWEGASIGGALMGSTHAVTSDNLLVRLDFEANFNAYGWQSWAVDNRAGSTSKFPADISSMLSTLVESSDDESPGDPMARFNPRTATSTIGCYVLNKDQLREFLNELWTTELIDSIRNSFIGDGANALLGVRWFYGIKDEISYGTSMAKITLGNVVFNGIPSQSVAVKEFVEYDAGSVVVPQFFGDFRDWTLTTYQAYLPFIGIVDLDPRDIVGKTLYLRYWINISDGSAICTLSTTPTTPSGTGTLFSTTCSWGYDVPVRVDSALDLASRMAKMALSAVPTAAGILGEAGQYSVGELSPNSNAMGDFEPKLIVNRREDLSGAGFAAADGAPGAAVTTVGAASGYLKAAAVHNAGSLAMRRSGEIIAMLKEGIYI